jgi:hypothetical protein
MTLCRHKGTPSRKRPYPPPGPTRCPPTSGHGRNARRPASLLSQIANIAYATTGIL